MEDLILNNRLLVLILSVINVMQNIRSMTVWLDLGILTISLK